MSADALTHLLGMCEPIGAAVAPPFGHQYRVAVPQQDPADIGKRPGFALSVLSRPKVVDDQREWPISWRSVQVGLDAQRPAVIEHFGVGLRFSDRLPPSVRYAQYQKGDDEVALCPPNNAFPSHQDCRQPAALDAFLRHDPVPQPAAYYARRARSSLRFSPGPNRVRKVRYSVIITGLRA